MSMLEIKNLHVEVEGKKILNGLSLKVEKGQVAAIMGPNGSGKSTLAYVLSGKPGYNVTEGDVLLDGQNILELSPDERAAKGVFLAFQYPVEVPGVATMTFLRTALNAQRKTRGEKELLTPEFMKLVRDTSAKLGIGQEMLRRAVNVGFSGGEKKRNEIMQMAILQPRLAVLDETAEGQTRSPRARFCSTARASWRWTPDERAAKGVFLAFQYPVEVPGVATMTFLRTALNAQRKTRGEPEFSTPDFMKLVREAAEHLGIRPGDAAPRGQCRFLGRREEAQRDPADGGSASRGWRCSTRPIPASTSTRSRSWPRASTGCARPTLDDRHHALPAAAQLTSCRTWCM